MKQYPNLFIAEAKTRNNREADSMLQQQKVQTATSSRPSEESPNSARLSSHSQYSNCKVVREKNQSKKSSVNYV